MSSSNCCFLTWIQISQEAGQVVWYSHLFKNFPQFVVVHTVKGFGIVNKGEVDVFLEVSCFFHDPVDVGNSISGSSAFSNRFLRRQVRWSSIPTSLRIFQFVRGGNWAGREGVHLLQWVWISEMLKNKIQPNNFEDLIDFIQWFRNQGEPHLATIRALRGAVQNGRFFTGKRVGQGTYC